jgi:hypothetical protein
LLGMIPGPRRTGGAGTSQRRRRGRTGFTWKLSDRAAEAGSEITTLVCEPHFYKIFSFFKKENKLISHEKNRNR